MDGNSPWGGQAPPPPPSGAQPQVPQNFGPPQPSSWQPPSGGQAARRGLLVPIGVGLAVLLSVAALVVALLKSGGNEPSPRPQPTSSADAESGEMLVDDADRSLCLAIGALMKESEDLKNNYLNTGPQNSADRKAAIPSFVADMQDWATRTQGVLNDHADPNRHLTRILERYIDDSVVYAHNLAPDRDSSKYENPIYDLGVMDYAGVLGRCAALNAGWWN